jgi:hypothetical protein
VVGWTDPESRWHYFGAAARLVRSRRQAGLCLAAPASASIPPSSNVCGGGYNRSRPTPCRWICRRAAAVSAHPWCSIACIGFGPELVAEVKFLTWTDDNLLRVVYEGLCEDRSAREVRRSVPHPKSGGA